MSGHTYTHTHIHTHTHTTTTITLAAHAHRGLMKSTKVQTLGGIWWKYWKIWIENRLHAYVYIIVLGIYRTSFQHNLHCFINACVHVVND